MGEEEVPVMSEEEMEALDKKAVEVRERRKRGGQ